MSDQHPGFSLNPSPVLEKVFNEVLEQRMQDMPLINRRVAVEAVGFEEWEGHWLGVLITPWFINLLLLRKDGSPWPQLELGKGNEINIAFPQGVYRFSPREETGVGRYLCCSLMSPLQEIKSHEEARGLALDVMRVIRQLPVVQLDSQDAAQTTACRA
ncbi:[NiFe]-hydrogenase assembly chaperone HybE [Aestuariirhabdus litorea]|uniref:[NiFe]-hydrogenase assembly, chaperone, HybE n=1 Tax=Aestuariirhabdus litorea TaxID=2528527 RepID=A0A3P3VS87_9GAMM|nr:[NiFe]-hydrogenase assembly chaperone HybE [Aestuariirhabdus litorea]RRJ83663.1 [NiFe]-hydrogenase assembly, chaperone, HybE [Aestuariirhabdus litorea]RWW96885.1 [NiFe]-hydrogenase assembly, chaperone, HybE [Endozoicomonadaceae bacterium GTF-13]